MKLTDTFRQLFIKCSIKNVYLYFHFPTVFLQPYSLYDRLISNRVSKYIFNNLIMFKDGIMPRTVGYKNDLKHGLCPSYLIDPTFPRWRQWPPAPGIRRKNASSKNYVEKRKVPFPNHLLFTWVTLSAGNQIFCGSTGGGGIFQNQSMLPLWVVLVQRKQHGLWFQTNPGLNAVATASWLCESPGF